MSDLPSWLNFNPIELYQRSRQNQIQNDLTASEQTMQDQRQQQALQLQRQSQMQQLQEAQQRNQLGYAGLANRQEIANTVADARREAAMNALQWHTQQQNNLKDFYTGKIDAANSRIDELSRHNQALEGLKGKDADLKREVDEQAASFWNDYRKDSDATDLLKKYPLVTRDPGVRSFLSQRAIAQRTADTQAAITGRADARTNAAKNVAKVTPTEGPYKGVTLTGDPNSDLIRTNSPGYVPPPPDAIPEPGTVSPLGSLPQGQFQAPQSDPLSALIQAQQQRGQLQLRQNTPMIKTLPSSPDNSPPVADYLPNYPDSNSNPVATPLRFKDKSGKTFRYVGSASDPTSDKDPNNWTQE